MLVHLSYGPLLLPLLVLLHLPLCFEPLLLAPLLLLLPLLPLRRPPFCSVAVIPTLDPEDKLVFELFLRQLHSPDHFRPGVIIQLAH
jgi:hypothetical protein